MSGISFVLNRITRSKRKEFAHWASEAVSDFLGIDDPHERAKVSKAVGAGVMITTGVVTSVAVADVVGLFDPANFLDAADALTYTDAAADPGIYSGGLDHVAAGHDGSQLHFGQDGTYVEPGDTIEGHTTDSNHDPVQWSNGRHINARTGQQVVPGT